MIVGKWWWLGAVSLVWCSASCSSDSESTSAAGGAAGASSAGADNEGGEHTGQGGLAGTTSGGSSLGGLAANEGGGGSGTAAAGGETSDLGGAAGAEPGPASDAGQAGAAGAGGGRDAIGGAATGGEGGAGGAGAGPTGPLLGPITGNCGQIDLAKIQSAEPSSLLNYIDLGAQGFSTAALSVSGKKVYDHTGGSNAAPSAVSYEVLASCESATLLKTGDEISYDVAGAKLQYSLQIAGQTLGVAVVRAVGFPDDTSYTNADAVTLLTKKLSDIAESSAQVSAADKWQKSILHVIARSIATANTTLVAYNSLAAGVKADTILLITITQGSDDTVYGL